MSTDETHDKRRPTSIDVALELERQLDEEAASPPPGSRPQSLDPHVLVSIVTQLRESLVAVTKERDDLVELVSGAHKREADLKDALQSFADKCEKMEDKLETYREQHKEDQDNILMLRSKVDESRRGLMQLQANNRRQSQSSMTLDLSRAGPPSAGGKRASFTPLTGSTGMHRRGVSVSEAPAGYVPYNPEIARSPPTPVTPGFSFPNTAPVQRSPGHNKRASGFFGQLSGSPGRLTPSPPPQTARETEALRRELASLRQELDDTRAELTESNEARDASESCVKALREFIAQGNPGESSSGSGSGSGSGPVTPSTPTRAPMPPSMKPRSNSSSSGSDGALSSGGRNRRRSSSSPRRRASSAGSSTAKRTSFSSISTSLRSEPLIESESEEDSGAEPASPEPAPAMPVQVAVHDGTQDPERPPALDMTRVEPDKGADTPTTAVALVA